MCTITVDNKNPIDDIKSIANTNQTHGYGFSTKSAAVAAFSMLDSSARRSFRGFANRNTNQTTNLTLSELSKNDEEDNNSSPYTENRRLSNPSIHASSTLVNAASIAYHKLLEFKTKRLPLSPTLEPRKTRSSSGSTVDLIYNYIFFS